MVYGLMGYMIYKITRYKQARIKEGDGIYITYFQKNILAYLSLIIIILNSILFF